MVCRQVILYKNEAITSVLIKGQGPYSGRVLQDADFSHQKAWFFCLFFEHTTALHEKASFLSEVFVPLY